MSEYIIAGNGGIDASTLVCSVRAKDGEQRAAQTSQNSQNREK